MFYSSCSTIVTPEKHENVKCRWRVPLQDANLEQATSFLELMYYQGDGEFAIDKVRSMMELLHRLDCPAAQQKMDAYLTGSVGHSVYHQPKPWVSVLVATPQGFSTLQLPCVCMLICTPNLPE